MALKVKIKLTPGRLNLFIWETTLGNRRIPDRNTEPYPQASGEQTRYAGGSVCLRNLSVTYMGMFFLSFKFTTSLLASLTEGYEMRK